MSCDISLITCDFNFKLGLFSPKIQIFIYFNYSLRLVSGAKILKDKK